MSPLDINESIRLLKAKMSEALEESEFSWHTLHHAQMYLESQLAKYFLEAA